MAAPHVAGLLLLGDVGFGGYAKSSPGGDNYPIAYK
jgi:hypothetical protein